MQAHPSEGQAEPDAAAAAGRCFCRRCSQTRSMPHAWLPDSSSSTHTHFFRLSSASAIFLPRSLSASAPPAPYGDALLAREYELWQRQAAMYERLLEQADHEQQRFAEERLEWKATEAALRQEAAELRAQLLYVLAQLNSGQAGGGAAAAQPGAAATAASSTSSYMASSQQAAIAAREPAAALASTSFGSAVSPAEQVKAVVDAMKAGAGGSTAQPPPPAVAPSSVSSSSVVSPSAAWPAGSNSELPSYAVDLAAAVAAVDTTDVLKGVGMFELQERRAAVQAEAAASILAATPVEEPGVAPPVEQPVAAPPQPAAAEADAEASHGPPPPLTLGADDIFWVNQARALLEAGRPALRPAAALW